MKEKLLLLCLLLGFSLKSPFALDQSQGEKPHFNVLLITIDTLRADRLSCYDNRHVQTPNIDSLAEKGSLFSRAFANTPTTLPSHASILLGTTPLHHGVHDNYNFIAQEKLYTLAEHLKIYGYATGAIIGAHPLDSRFGLDQGFDMYDDDFERLSSQKFAYGERGADAVAEKAIDWLRIQKFPWFLWAHFFDPHEPYEPAEPFRTEYKNHPYDGEVALVDFELGKILDFMKSKNLFKDTLIILTSDHGESLEEHGERTHGYFAYNSTIWVPLIITLPHGSRRVVDEYVNHIDIFPTVCEALQVPAPSTLQGISLQPALDGKTIQRRPIYFESLYPYYSRGWAPLKGYISNGKKFIDSPIPELYDLNDDFNEARNIAKENGLGKYRKELDEILKNQSSSESGSLRQKVDRKELEKLKSLGYISEPFVAGKKNFGPRDDIKTLLPFHRKAEKALQLHNDGKTRDGMQLLKEILSEKNDIDVAYVYLAGIYEASGKTPEALEVYRLGLENLPSSYKILTPYVELLFKAERYNEVISVIKTKKLLPMENDAEIWMVLAKAYQRVGEIDRSLNAYEKAQSIDHEDDRIYAALGEVYFSKYLKTKNREFFHRSVENFKKAIELNSDCLPAYEGLGHAYGEESNLEGAIFCWEKALELKPDHYLLLFNLGIAYYNLGDRTKACESFHTVREKYYSQLSLRERKLIDEYIRKCESQDR